MINHYSHVIFILNKKNIKLLNFSGIVVFINEKYFFELKIIINDSYYKKL